MMQKECIYETTVNAFNTLNDIDLRKQEEERKGQNLRKLS